MIGKAIRIARRTQSTATNGITPRNTVPVLHLRQQRLQHEQVHAHRRADQADLDHHHDQDAEPDRVDAQVHDEREEHRHREQDHGQLLHRGAEHARRSA